MGCKEHNRENALMRVIKCNEENMVLFCKVTIRATGDVKRNDVSRDTHFEIFGFMGRRLK